MSLIDFILNLAGLLLWLSWRTSRFDPMAGATPATLVGTLRRADTPRLRRWHFLAAIGGLILLRAIFYWQIGGAVDWAGNLDLSVISISFRSDLFRRMLLYSVFSFAVTLAAFLLCMLFLSLLGRRDAQMDAVCRVARLHIGVVDSWPRWLKLLLPLIGIGLLWWLLSWPLVYWGLLPPPVSGVHRLEQSLVIGLGSYLVWKYIIAGVLTLYLMNSYVYFGSHPFWGQVSATARRILKPLNRVPLAVGKVDFAPVVGIVIVFFLARLAELWLTRLYAHLPL